MTEHWHIIVNPTVPWTILGLVAGVSVVLCLAAALGRARGAGLRFICCAFVVVFLANPSLLNEKRQPLKDTVLLVVDDSASTTIGDRRQQIQIAVDHLTAELQTFGDLEIETMHVTGDEETDLFQTLAPKLATMPKDRLAGIIAITDGEIHDAPTAALPAPFHVLIAGHKDEIDRRLSLKVAPAYGIVGKKVTLTLRIDDEPTAQSDQAPVTYSRDDGASETIIVPVGKDVPIDVSVDHAGQNMFAFQTPTLANEITPLNNTTTATVNGIRDRLRVLLVSGEPHIGGRTWRNLLKADPAVDLVHFTILRSPTKNNYVPASQLSLITFPVRELFETKLASFDLVIFDRFSSRSLLPDEYLANIARYVENGGALLISNATDDEAATALADTPLSRLLPTQATGRVLTGSFVPRLTDTGERHPVTSSLDSVAAHDSWGPWFRQIETSDVKGDVLMTGLNGQPLLVLNRAGNGRVAQFLSDQFWLWSRGYKGAGPQAELLRRVAHWLVQEPELDEMALKARAEYDVGSLTITVDKQSLRDDSATVSLIDSAGQTSQLTLAKGTKPGTLTGTARVATAGLYHVKDGDKEILLMAGTSTTPEFGAMVATAQKLQPSVEATGGGVFWLDDKPTGPSLKRTSMGDVQNGSTWLGLRRNGQFKIVGTSSQSLCPPWAALALLLAALLATWRYEAITRQRDKPERTSNIRK